MKLARSLFVKEAVLFGVVHGLGLLAAFRFLTDSRLSYLVPEVSTNWHLNLLDIFVLVAFVFVFIFLSRKKGLISKVFFRIFLWAVVFSGAQVFFSIFMSPFKALISSLVLILFMALIPRVVILDIGVIFGLAGIGSTFGLSLAPIVVVWILAILSFYDIIAVYLTKHMVKMAGGMIASGAIFGFIIPANFSGFKEKISSVGPGENFMILGSGDLLLPLILTVSVARISFLQAIIVGIFSLFGLLATHLIFVNQKERRPMAALPPIAALSIIGYLLSSFLF